MAMKSEILPDGASGNEDMKSSKTILQNKEKLDKLSKYTFQYDIKVPPGRLGLILAKNVGDKSGTIVVGSRAESPITGQIFPGSMIIAVDREDVSHMVVSEINAVITKNIRSDRILTIASMKKPPKAKLLNSIEAEEEFPMDLALRQPQEKDTSPPSAEISGNIVSVVSRSDDNLQSFQEDSILRHDAASQNADSVPHKIYWNIITICIVYILSFTRIIATQLPNLFFLIELDQTYGMDLKLGGIFMATGYISRLATRYLLIWAPKTAVYLGSFLGLAGYAIIFLTDDKVPFIVAYIMIQASDISAALQIFIKDFYDNVGVMGHMLWRQYYVNSFGLVCVWLIGGFLYNDSVTLVVLFGAVILIFQILVLSVYFSLSTRLKAVKRNEARRENNMNSKEKKGLADINTKEKTGLDDNDQDKTNSLDLSINEEIAPEKVRIKHVHA
eukprot:CAMPEP_0194299868 /NCGR_PEP_ID=MMETSP0169-20130528/60949_1 /TAXON_ID=218684 /ORGANISM="Corethron pennatum, Strain L29A3" /LENGTH=443 /DNA_ID=CAMNT_0039049991 /DNA_START=154 /DNA_END=1485 /DNA_ORIENTATION=-